MLTAEQRQNAAAAFERAHQFLGGEQTGPAIKLLLHCCRLDPTNLIYRQTLRSAQRAHLGQRRGRFAAFLTWLPRRRLRAAPPDEALLLAEDVLCLDPWNAEAQRLLARALNAKGATDAALWSLEQAGDADPEELARLYEQRGNFFRAQELRGQRADALPEAEVTSLREQITRQPERLQNYLDLADLYRSAGRLQDSRAVLQQGGAATRQRFQIGLALAQLDIEPFRRDLALTEEKLAAAPQEDLRALRDRLLQEINNREIGIYRLLGDRFPGQLAHRFELGVRLLKAGQFEEALTALTAAAGDDRYRWRALMYSGYCYLNLQQLAAARKMFEQTLALVPQNEEAIRREVEQLLRNQPQPAPRMPRLA